MIAALNRKYAASIRELAFFHVLNPRAIDADWQIVFLLARNGTCVASDAFAVVNDKSVIHMKTKLYNALLRSRTAEAILSV